MNKCTEKAIQTGSNMHTGMRAGQIGDRLYTGRRVFCDPRSVRGWDLDPRVREAGGAVLGYKLSVHEFRSMDLVLLQMRTSKES